jgi:hypothetical protein
MPVSPPFPSLTLAIPTPALHENDVAITPSPVKSSPTSPPLLDFTSLARSAACISPRPPIYPLTPCLACHPRPPFVLSERCFGHRPSPSSLHHQHCQRLIHRPHRVPRLPRPPFLPSERCFYHRPRLLASISHSHLRQRSPRRSHRAARAPCLSFHRRQHLRLTNLHRLYQIPLVRQQQFNIRPRR